MAPVCHTRTHFAQLRVALRLRVADVFPPPEQIQGWEGGSKFSRDSLRAAMLPDSSSYIECGPHVTSETSVCFVKLLLYLQFNIKLCFKNC